MNYKKHQMQVQYKTNKCIIKRVITSNLFNISYYICTKIITPYTMIFFIIQMYYIITKMKSQYLCRILKD